MNQQHQSQVVDAVARLFEPTKAFQDQFAPLAHAVQDANRLGAAALKAFEPLVTLESNLAQLADAFEPMKAFQAQVALLAQTFEPLKGLQSHLAQLSQAFQEHLQQLVTMLEPAKGFQARLASLARAFEPAEALQTTFIQLLEKFAMSPPEGGTSASAQTAPSADGHAVSAVRGEFAPIQR